MNVPPQPRALLPFPWILYALCCTGAAAGLLPMQARGDTFEFLSTTGVWSDETKWRKTAGTGEQLVPSEAGDVARATYTRFGSTGANVTTELDGFYSVGQITAVGSSTTSTARTWTIDGSEDGGGFTMEQPDESDVTISVTGRNFALVIRGDIELTENNLKIQNSNNPNNNITIDGSIYDSSSESPTDIAITNNASSALIQVGSIETDGQVVVDVGTGVASGATRGRVEITGSLSGEATLIKETNTTNFASTLTLSGEDNSYTGGTIINGGGIRATIDSALGLGDVTIGNSNGAFLTLDSGLTNNYIDDDAAVVLMGFNSRVNLNFIGTDVIGSLFIGSAELDPGIYGAIGNLLVPSNHQFAMFTGTGTFTIVPEPASGALLAMGAVGLLIRRRRR